MYQIISRKGVLNYYFSKLFVVFVAGFINALYIFELFYLYQRLALVTTSLFVSDGSAFLTFLYPEENRALFLNYIVKHPIKFPHMLFFAISVFDGMCGCLSYSLGNNSDNETVSYIGGFIFPFIISFAFGLLQGKWQILCYYNLFQIITDITRASEAFNLIGIAVWISILSVISVLLVVVHEKANR